jgi:plastocyanin
MRDIILAGASAAALAAAGCGGSYDSGTNVPTGPPAPTAVTITIVGERANQSFSPSPATVAPGQPLVWRNTDNIVHRIKFNDDRLDTGEIAPGGSSAPRPMPTEGANYHCTLHPGMVGSIRAASTVPPPTCEGPYC